MGGGWFPPHCQVRGVSLHNNIVYYSAVFLFRDRPAKFPPSPLCCLIFPPLFLAKVQALASFCSDFLHPALSQIGALGAFMLLQLQADREMFGNVSAPRPSLNEAPVAVGTVRCFLILRRNKCSAMFLCLAAVSQLRSSIPHEHGQTVSVKCQRATRGGRPVRRGQCRGQCLARLKSRMRSHSGNKLWTSLPTAETGGIPGDTDGKEAPPPSCHTSAHHTSHKLHAPFRLECGGPASRMVSLTHSIVFARCFVACSASLYTPENLPPWEKKNCWGKPGEAQKVGGCLYYFFSSFIVGAF